VIQASIGLAKTIPAKKNSIQNRICNGTGNAEDVVGRKILRSVSVRAICTTLSAMDRYASAFVETLSRSAIVMVSPLLP
jgi:hypothetical protein